MAVGKTRKKLNAKASRGSGGGGGGDMQKIYYDPLGFETSVLFTVQEISVETAQLSLSSPGTFQFTLEGQKVKIESGTTTLPTGIGHIITTVTLSDALVYGYSQVAQAYVTALGVYVPCTYGVATNKLRLQIRGYKTSLTTDQIKNLYIGGTYVEVVPAFGANTFTDVKHISTYLNIPGAVYNNAAGFYFSYDPDAGNILFNNPTDFLGAGGEYFIQFQQQFNNIDTILINTPVYVFDMGSATPSTTGSGSADIYIDFDVIFN